MKVVLMLPIDASKKHRKKDKKKYQISKNVDFNTRLHNQVYMLAKDL